MMKLVSQGGGSGHFSPPNRNQHQGNAFTKNYSGSRASHQPGNEAPRVEGGSQNQQKMDETYLKAISSMKARLASLESENK